MWSTRAESSSNLFRRRRFERFERLVNGVLARQPTCSVLDLGGTHGYWKTFGAHLDWTRVNVVVLNSEQPAAHAGEDRIELLVGDARAVGRFADHSFDIVHSNSVIEHVGRWDDMVRMASEVRRLAPRYFVQTPNFWFPLEPHFRVPFFHWMPETWRYRILMRRACGSWEKQTTIDDATRAVQSVMLLDTTQMQSLFPDANIVQERFAGMTKSLIAIR